ncbi:polyprotein of Ty1/Copia retrotransposon [Cycloclasticus sp.]|uniref:Ty1/Copia family ribonuclease HI n=1 Tax=Cycloclasticus sp. TaxID=2024830 RepID=UPI00258005F7|nr:polyprotein of Ty1/Copia retrotransposon [Cycloclasticus sp.]
MEDLTEIPAVFDKWCNDVQKRMRRMGCENVDIELASTHLRTDSASYFKAGGIQKRMQKWGIELTFSSPYSQYENGRAELCVKYLKQHIRGLLTDAKLTNKYWSMALEYSVRIHDFLPKADGSPSPRHARGEPDSPNEARLQPFGCECVAVTHEKGTKASFPNPGKRGIFIGVDEATSCSRVLIGSKIWLRRDVSFNPDIPRDYSYSDIPHAEYDSDDCDDYDYQTDSGQNSGQINPEHGPEQLQHEFEDMTCEIDENEGATSPRMDQSEYQGPIGPNDVTEDEIFISNLKVHSLSIPVQVYYSRAEAHRAFDGNYPGELEKAIQAEVKALLTQALTEVDPCSINSQETIHSLLSLYSDKRECNKHVKLKLRLCWNGKNEVQGVHYDLSSSYNPRAATTRWFYSLSPLSPLEESWDGDVSTAYLKATLPTPPHGGRHLCKFPIDLIPRRADGKVRVFQAHHAIYGMKAGGRYWIDHLAKKINDYGLTQSKIEPSLFFSKQIRVLIYTDNVMCRGEPAEILRFKMYMDGKFGDMGWRRTTQSVGFEIHKKENGYHQLSQKYYTDKLVTDNKMNNSSEHATPLPSNETVTKTQRSPVDLGLSTIMRSLVGACNYQMVFSRPDIAYAMSALGTVTSSPMPIHITWAKRVIKYLKGTKDYVLNYRPTNPKQKDIIYACSDASFARQDDYRSQCAYTIYMNSAPIDWQSWVEKKTAQSTFEAELYALNECIRRIQYFRHLSEEIGITQELTKIGIDAKALYNYARNKNVTKRNLHLGVRDQYCRQEEGVSIILEEIDGELLPADLITKQNGEERHRKLTKLLFNWSDAINIPLG